MPRREAIFQDLKDTHDLAVGHHTPGIRVLCPTRWTVCANALATESKARINGVAAQMKTYDFVFGATLGEMVL